MAAGKGDDARSNYSKEFRDNMDAIPGFGKRQTRRCPHNILIGGDCPDCVRAMPPTFLVPLNHKTKTR